MLGGTSRIRAVAPSSDSTPPIAPVPKAETLAELDARLTCFHAADDPAGSVGPH